jgi:hypothetical protein
VTTAATFDRTALLEEHGRVYGELELSIAWTVGLEGDAAKVSRNWQKRPFRLSGGDHGAAMLRTGLTRNPVVSLRSSGLVGVDVDGEAGRMLVRELVPGGLPATVIVVSGRPDGGAHFWYRPPGEGAPAKIEFSAGGLELASDGYLVIPPAVHETGTQYTFADGYAPWQREIVMLPAGIVHALQSHGKRIDNAERADDGGPVREGHRHRHLLRLGCAMRRVGAGETVICAALLAENELRCVPPEDNRVVRDLAHDIAERYAAGDART